MDGLLGETLLCSNWYHRSIIELEDISLSLGNPQQKHQNQDKRECLGTPVYTTARSWKEPLLWGDTERRLGGTKIPSSGGYLALRPAPNQRVL